MKVTLKNTKTGELKQIKVGHDLSVNSLAFKSGLR